MHPFLKKSDIPSALGLLFTIGILFSPLMKIYIANGQAPEIIVFGLSTIGKNIDYSQIRIDQQIQLSLLFALFTCWIFTFFLNERLKAHAFLLISFILITFPVWLMNFVEGNIKGHLTLETVTQFSSGLLFVGLSLITCTFALLEMPLSFTDLYKPFKEKHILDAEKG